MEKIDMHRAALILTMLTACLVATAGARAAAPDAGVGVPTPLASVQAVAIPAWLPLAQEPVAADTAETDPVSEQAAPAREGTPVAQQIAAGVLTGSLAAVLMFRLFYGRRRKDDMAEPRDAA